MVFQWILVQKPLLAMVFQWFWSPKPLVAMVFQWFWVQKPLVAMVFQWFPMVANHWSDDGMVAIHRSGLIVHHLMRKIFANSVLLCTPDLTPCHIIDILNRYQPYLSRHIYCRISESHTFPLALLRHGYLTTNTMFSLIHLIKDFFVL